MALRGQGHEKEKAELEKERAAAEREAEQQKERHRYDSLVWSKYKKPVTNEIKSAGSSGPSHGPALVVVDTDTEATHASNESLG